MTCEKTIVRGVLLRTMRGLTAAHSISKIMLDFGRKHGPWLLGLSPSKAEKLSWTGFVQAVRKIEVSGEPASPMLELGQNLARLLDLDKVDTAIALAMLAFDRMPRASELAEELARTGVSLPLLVGEAGGAKGCEAERLVRQHAFVALGLVSFKSNWRGQIEMSIGWTLSRLLDRQPSDVAGILELLIGPRQSSHLPFDAFAHVKEVGFLKRLLEGARRERARGISILIHGPPGTGKTELARALAAEAGCRLHAVGEADEDGEEPTRFDRICSYQIGQRLLGSSDQDVLLFDEMEDFIGDTQRGDGDWFRGREGSKVFVNRLLETNTVPVIWTTNAIGNVDPAILRRMSFILKLDYPSRSAALGILGRVAREEAVTPGAEWGSLIEQAPETGSVLRVAARAARLAGEEDGGIVPARSLVKALRGHDLPPSGSGEVDLSLYESNRCIASLVKSISAGEHLDVSVLLTGPPGTGKTALAHHFARELDRPLMVRRSSDLLSRWVGGTEANIADAFADARESGSVLLLDEVDSLLFDRSQAKTNWEVSQVNELLTWLDSHPLPVIAATNFAAKLDPATARRFTFKLELRALSPAKAAAAFQRFFECKAPSSLARLGNLTPGDFALVKRQLRHAPCDDPRELVARLAEEAEAKPGAARAIGF